MKKNVAVISAAIVLVVGAGVVAARAARTQSYGWHHGWRGHGPMTMLAWKLNLTDSQKAQVKTIWQGERPTVAALLKELSAEQKQMNAANVDANFDASKVQSITNSQAETIQKLLIERQKIESQIYVSVLMPEQRTKFDQLKQNFPERLDKIAERIAGDSGQKQ
ncbi:MAG TPA: Spy/CpxP family protein refolding chaperone [Terriglobales bacterium]|nr:Spy/CpxP family protein refolding chaperone [Terriglobales bacterium]